MVLIIPCFNEEESLQKNINIFKNKLEELKNRNLIHENSFLLFIDDGSFDKTPLLLENAIDSNTKAIILSRNRGHQNALLAGLEFACNKCDCAISIDCDLQQDINKLEDFIHAFNEGNEIVFGVRKDRKSDGIFKKFSALFFYKIMRIFGVDIISNHADYRLLSNKALNFLMQYKEINLFLRGIFLELGLKHSIVYFDVKDRELGVSKYNLSKMISLALNGITSFSVTPLRLIVAFGFLISIGSACFGIYAFLVFLNGKAISGWASTIIPIYFIGGIQMLSIGIIGEYIGKIYKETKNRPRYLIDRVLESK